MEFWKTDFFTLSPLPPCYATADSDLHFYKIGCNLADFSHKAQNLYQILDNIYGQMFHLYIYYCFP